MAEQYSFFNSKEGDRKYNARNWADYFFPLFKSGVFNGDLQVVTNGGMSVRVKEGYAWIDGYVYHLTDGLVLDLETASGNMNRADSIVIRLDLTNRWIKGFCVTGGNYTGTPTPPEPAVTATVHELVIANVSVPAGATEITQDMITDTRMDGNLCGWVCGAVDQIKFEQIKAQFDAFFSKYSSDIKTAYDNYMAAMGELEESAQAEYEEMLESFTAWIEGIKEVLSGDVAGNLLLKIEERMEKAVYDADNDGIVDNAKRLDGKEAGDYLQKAAVIDNPDDVGAVTEQGYPVGCVALNGLLGGIRFGVDDAGNYGYIKAGADTVTPFRNGAMMIGTFSGGYPSAAAATSKYTNLTTYANSIITIDGVLPSMVADDYIAVVTGYNADHYSNWAGSTSNGTGASLKIVITDNKTITVKNTGVCTINYAGDTQYRYLTRARVEGKVYYIGK